MNTQCSEQIDQRRAAVVLRRRLDDEEATASELAAEIERWLRLRCLLAGDLDAGDGDALTLRNGIAYCDLRLGELSRMATRLARAMRRRDWPTERLAPDLGPRFAAAKHADLVAVIAAVTGEAPIPSGRRYRLVCPFHGDRNPSLVVYPAGRGWYCFACQAGGDAVSFVTVYYGCSPVAALATVEGLSRPLPPAIAS